MKLGGNRLADDLADHVRDRILSGNLAAGTRLAEAGLAQEYSVARPTVRSALDVLIADGLVTRQSRQQPVVATVGEDEVHDILALLRLTENLAFDRLIAGDPDMRPARSAISSTTHNLLQVLVEATDSDRLSLVHRRSTFELLLFSQRRPTLPSRTPSQIEELHRSLLQAIIFEPEHSRELLSTIQEERDRATLSPVPASRNDGTVD